MSDGPSLFWNPAAVAYLAEALLAFAITAYLAIRTWRDWRHGRLSGPTVMLTVMMACLVVAFLASLARMLAAGGWVGYAMPWSDQAALTTLIMPWAAPFGGVAAAGLAFFAYRFPRPLPGAGREAVVVAVLGAGCVIAEAVMALMADVAILQSRAWWRPDWVAGWMVLSVTWAAVVFWRQFVHAQPNEDGAATPVTGAIAAFFGPAANREASAARGFLVFIILPIAHTATLVVPGERQVGLLSLDIVLTWSVLAQLVGFALVLVGYMPERSSFVSKLTAISLALVLGAINGAAWIVEPVSRTLFQAPELVTSGQALRLMPSGQGEYSLRPIAFAPDGQRGAELTPAGRIDLPFEVRFYGRRYETVYVSERGSIGFDRIAEPADAAFRRGGQPAIHPLLVDTPPAGSRIFARVRTDRLVVTRVDQCGDAPESCYGFQTVLHANGVVEFHYTRVPIGPEYRLFSPTYAPWLIGLTPGADAPPAARPLVRDYYRDFLTSMNGLMAPFVGYIIIAPLAVILIMPLLYQGFLIRPLGRLLEGLRQFRSGRLETRLEVKFSDEVGYLTESFNEMARAQQALVHGLEARIADRVAEIGDITVRNAQLEERNRLSADLHDAVAQTLSSASLLANALAARLQGISEAGVDTAERIAGLNRHALSELRELLHELRDVRQGEWSVTERLQELAASFQALHDLKVECDFGSEAPLPKDVRTILFRVAQESLNNVVKHGGTNAARISFEALERRALLVISDEGRGFEADAIFDNAHLGLAIMRDRARQVGAVLEVESWPGQGSRVTMIWERPDAD